MSNRVENNRTPYQATQGLLRRFLFYGENLQGDEPKNGTAGRQWLQEKETKLFLTKARAKPSIFLKDFLSIFFSIRCMRGLKNTNGAIEKTQMVRRTNTNGAKQPARPDRAVMPELTQKVREKTHGKVEMCS